MTEQTKLDAAVETVERLDAVLREGRGQLGDLIRERRALEATMEEARDLVRKEAEKQIDEAVVAEVRRAMETLGGDIKGATEKAYDRLMDGMTKLVMNFFTGDNRGHGENLLDMIARAKDEAMPDSIRPDEDGDGE